jgi:RNA polymerase sigma-70 factor, ECF subfamily
VTSPVDPEHLPEPVQPTERGGSGESGRDGPLNASDQASDMQGRAPEEETAVEVLQGGDQRAFAALVQPHRRELRVHCYRMLGSFDEAEDQVQETLLQAWRSRETFQGRATLRAWLYRIATNACLQFLRRQPRPPVPADPDARGPSAAALPWLQPFPDALLDLAAPADQQPDAVVVARETIALAYLAAIQVLPAGQRAVLLLRDVLAFSAAEAADVLDVTVAAANSSLQRARATLAGLQRDPTSAARSTKVSRDEQALLTRYISAHEQADPAAIVAVLREDARLTISPLGLSWDGRDQIRQPFLDSMASLGVWRCVPTRANRQPAVGMYLRKWGDDTFRAWSLVVLGIDGDRISEMATFAGSALFPAFMLPSVLT